VERATAPDSDRTDRGLVSKNQNTFEKRRREMEKKRKADEKRQSRRRRKEEPATPADESQADNDQSESAV